MDGKNRLRNIIPFEIKEIKNVTEEGEFEAAGAVFGNIDSAHDKIASGAFKKTLRENKKFPLLWQHDWHEPIGSFSAEESEKALVVKGKFNLQMVGSVPKVPNAQKAHALLSAGDISGFSIGYDVIKHSFEKIKNINIRVIQELKLWEVSIVTFPANPKAVLLDIKSINDFWYILEENKHDEKFVTKLFSLFGVEPSAIDTFLKPSMTGTKTSDQPGIIDRYKKIINSQLEVNDE